MKLLFVHDHKFRKKDGAFYSTGALDHMALKRYVRVFDEVIILARVINEDDCDHYSKIEHTNVKIIDIRNITLKEIKQAIRECDRLIVRLPSFYGLLALHLNSFIKKKYLIEMVGCPWDEFWNYSFITKFIAPLITILDRYYVKNAPYVIYVTTEFLQKRYPTKGRSIACSNVTLVPTDEQIIIKRRQHIRTSKAPYVIGTTAAIDVKYKGQQFVIKALKYLIDQGNTNYRYQIVGNGNPGYLSRIIKKYNLEDYVEIIGGLPHERVFDWLDTIDIYIQPSKQEGLPRALIEAMSRGLPAIGANTAGIPELLSSRYIYNHSLKEYISIANLLTLIVSEMEYLSEKNYNESKKYDNTILEERRNRFLTEFATE